MSTRANAGDRDARGYRVQPGHGPRVRSDVIDVYVVRRAPRARAGWQFLQLRRAKDPLRATWQPIMGHIEPGEAAVAAALREVREEVGLDARGPHVRAVWALEQVHPYYLPAIDCIVLSPRFVVEVAPAWSPVLNAEHDGARWVHQRSVRAQFMWPGQHAAIAEALAFVLRPRAPARDRLRLAID